MPPKRLVIGYCVSVIILTGACAEFETMAPVRVESDFGNSQRAILAAQIENPLAVEINGLAPVDQFHGQQSVRVLEVFTNDVYPPKDVQKDITININTVR